MVGRILSPLVVGRDDFLDLADRRIAETKAGRGQLLILSGEAGIGKTRLLAAIRQMAQAVDFAAAEGAVLPEDRNVPAASFLDLARNLQRRREFGTLGSDVLAAIRDVPGEGGPARRAIVRDTVDLFVAAASKPILFVFEDLHWADDLSLELLAELARAIRDRPMLLVGSYRTEEVGPGTSLRAWRSRLVTQRAAEELRLGRLSLAETSLLITLILARTLPTPRDVALAVHQRTDGVPLFVEELLAALGPAAADRRTIAEADVPETVQDATLLRVARLSPQARSIAGAGAVIGRRFSLDILAHILDQPADDLVDPLQELVDTGILDAAPGHDLYDFHHQVLRDALYGALPARDRKRLHGQAARFGSSMEGIGETDASAHFERAGMTAEAFHAATAAARNAARLASHREAEDLYRRAIRNLPPDLDPGAAAVVHEDHGRELAAIDDNEGAAAALLEARRLYEIAGKVLPAAAILVPLAWVRHLLGDGVGVIEPLLRGGLAEIDAVPDSHERRQTRARLVAALAYAIGIAFRIEDAEPLAREALRLAIETGDDRTRIAALATIGGLLVPFNGRITEGFEHADAAIALARAGGYDEELARALRVTGSMASEVLDYERAERYLREGIEFSDRRQLGNHLNYMRAHTGLVLWATGRWDEALATAEQAEADGRGGVTTRITARYVQGFVHLGRGEVAAAQRDLDDCLSLAEGTGELYRLSFPFWGLAELALRTGNPNRAVELTARAWATSTAVHDVTLFLPCIVTGTRARLAVADPATARAWLSQIESAAGSIAVPAVHLAIGHAHGLVRLRHGNLQDARSALEAAAAGWAELGRVWESLWAQLDLASCLQRMRRWAEAGLILEAARGTATALRSRPVLDAIEELARAGRGRSSGAEPWYPLTVREFEVAQRIAAGMTNTEVADELVISPKTASAHVEHILAKLGVARRAEIGAWVATVRHR